MKKLITAIILVLVSMTAMADESKVNDKVLLDISVINTKFEQILQERLRSELSQENTNALKGMISAGSDKVLMHTMDFFKVDTSLPE